jgi:hypothetical protein
MSRPPRGLPTDSLFADKFDTNPRYQRPAAGIAAG